MAPLSSPLRIRTWGDSQLYGMLDLDTKKRPLVLGIPSLRNAQTTKMMVHWQVYKRASFG